MREVGLLNFPATSQAIQSDEPGGLVSKLRMRQNASPKSAFAQYRLAAPQSRKDTEPYLLQQYTNDDGVMICQVCKKALPFKLADGRYFFEAVEFLPELMKHHYQNYLVLCPNHAAMYQYANEAAELMKDLFLNLSEMSWRWFLPVRTLPFISLRHTKPILKRSLQ